jgi:hypothetical protein
VPAVILDRLHCVAVLDVIYHGGTSKKMSHMKRRLYSRMVRCQSLCTT